MNVGVHFVPWTPAGVTDGHELPCFYVLRKRVYPWALDRHERLHLPRFPYADLDVERHNGSSVRRVDLDSGPSLARCARYGMKVGRHRALLRVVVCCEHARGVVFHLVTSASHGNDRFSGSARSSRWGAASVGAGTSSTSASASPRGGRSAIDTSNRGARWRGSPAARDGAPLGGCPCARPTIDRPPAGPTRRHARGRKDSAGRSRTCRSTTAHRRASRHTKYRPAPRPSDVPESENRDGRARIRARGAPRVPRGPASALAASASRASGTRRTDRRTPEFELAGPIATSGLQERSCCVKPHM